MARATNLGVPFTFQFPVTASGTPEQLRCKRRAATISFTAQSDTSANALIDDSGNGFLIAGFQAGDVVTVSGASNAANNAAWEIITVTAGRLTLHTKHNLTTEAAGATVTIVAPKWVPDGVSVAVKAIRTNTGIITVADSSAKALNTTTGNWALQARDIVHLQVTSTDVVWLDAGVTSEGVEVIFEKAVQG